MCRTQMGLSCSRTTETHIGLPSTSHACLPNCSTSPAGPQTSPSHRGQTTLKDMRFFPWTLDRHAPNTPLAWINIVVRQTAPLRRARAKTELRSCSLNTLCKNPLRIAQQPTPKQSCLDSTHSCWHMQLPFRPSEKGIPPTP